MSNTVRRGRAPNIHYPPTRRIPTAPPLPAALPRPLAAAGARVFVCDIDPEALADWCGEKLAPFKVPAHWEFREEPLPRNATGKVLKNVLLGQAENTFVEE